MSIPTEYYQHTSPRRYWRGVPHTDTIQYTETPEGEEIYSEVLDYAEYCRTIDANSSDTYEEEDYPAEGIRVIVRQS